MFINFHQLPGLVFMILLLACLNSCGNPTEKQDGNETSETEQPENDTASLLDRQQTLQLISNYTGTYAGIDSSFIFKGALPKLENVVSFNMNQLQRDTFFHTLGNLDSLAAVPGSGVDSVRIRVQMALWQSGGEAPSTQNSNFVPILTFVVNANTLIYPTYPLASISPLVNWKTFECPDTSGSVEPLIEINCETAKELIVAWEGVAVDSVSQQLYLDTCSPPDTNRVSYYTFDYTDTQNIEDRYQEIIAQRGKTCYFYMHLGKLDEDCYIPMRNVLHLEEKDLLTEELLAATASTYFEFSKPCPKYCNQ